MDRTTLAAARILRFLESEPVVWLSTVRPDGGAHLVRIWFWWDGEALLVFSKPGAQKVRNLRANPSVMLAPGDAEDDFDVGMLEGRAELLDRPTSELLPPAHLAKYARQLAAIGLTAEDYAATYSQVLRIVPVRLLGWHGRETPRSVRLDGAPAVSIVEPRRATAVDGEPVGGLRRLLGVAAGSLRAAVAGAWRVSGSGQPAPGTAWAAGALGQGHPARPGQRPPARLRQRPAGAWHGMGRRRLARHRPPAPDTAGPRRRPASPLRYRPYRSNRGTRSHKRSECGTAQVADFGITLGRTARWH